MAEAVVQDGAATNGQQDVDYGYEDTITTQEEPSISTNNDNVFDPTTTSPHYIPPPASFPKRPTMRRTGLMGLRTVSMQQQEKQRQGEPNYEKEKKKKNKWRHQTSVDTVATEEPSASTAAAHNFAVRSIRRGTQEWHELVKPFVADLAFYSVVSRHFSRQNPLFRPYTTQAAVLFVDISGYSKIASLLQDRGAHALSTAVNSYLSRILWIVRQYGGDVVKFAGDAVLCLWHGKSTASTCRDNDNNNENSYLLLCQNILAAALCATQLQIQAGRHEVEGINQEFQIHVGLCCGTVESEIFVAPNHQNMQRMYHLVGGEALEEIGDLVDLAKAGQICVSAHVAEHLNAAAAEKPGAFVVKYEPVPDYQVDSDTDDDDDSECKGPPQLLMEFTVDNATANAVENFVEETMIDRLTLRDRAMEDDFIHPNVLDLLSHGGLSPTQIAQMRDLVVLFIAQTSHGSPANWLIEVQAILDRNQCPLLQIVADDKGVHAIAAVNAVAAVPESRLLGLEICRQLVRQRIGVAIGMAAGSTFCGVTGSSSVACRWDITGGPPVRAARLMQYALKRNVPMAIDESLYAGSIVPARMTVLEVGVPIKGSPAPIRIFTLSEATEFAAMNLLETVHGEMHNNQVNLITKHITGLRHRTAVIVTGPTLSGKKIVCQRAAGFANMVPFLHVSDSARGLLQLARTVANWFKYVEDERVHSKAKSVVSLMNQGLFSSAHDECLSLVDDALDAGLVACFVVDRVEFLDDFSISFIRECLHGRRYRMAAAAAGPPKLGLQRPSLSDSLSDMSLNGGSGGRISFLCVHVPLYNRPSADSVAGDITRSHRSLTVPVIEVLEATLQQFRELINSMTGGRFEDRLIYAASAAAGHCAGYFIERSAAIAQVRVGRLKRGQKPLVVMCEDFTNCIPRGSLREYRSLPVMQVGSEIAMRFAHVYDELPPIMQVFCKALAVVSQTSFYWAPRQRVWEVLNDLIAEGVTDETMCILLKEMSTLYLIRLWVEDGVEYVKFQSPGLADIAMDVCTPVQVEHIAKAWIGRLKQDVQGEFRVALVVAWLSVMMDPCKKCRHQIGRSVKYWREAYHAMLRVSKEEQWGASKVDRWKELIAAEIDAGGSDELDVLGSDFSYGSAPPKAVELSFLGVFMYRGPIGLGPLGNTMSVIAEQIIKEGLSFNVDAAYQRQELNTHMASAVERYLAEVEIVEDLLRKHDLGSESAELQSEKESLAMIATPATERSQVSEKGIVFANTVVKRFVEPRLDRLRTLTEKLDGVALPSFVSNSRCDSILTAYQIMFKQWTCVSQASQVDRAQHALMILATRGWQPRMTPEPLGHLKHQTVARLRNAVVRKLSEGQLHYSKHQQSAVDLKAFLLTTTLLFDAQDTKKYDA